MRCAGSDVDRQGGSTVLEMLADLSAGAIGSYEDWLDTWLAQSGRMARLATAWSNEALGAQRAIAVTMADAIVETEMALAAAAAQPPVSLLARLGETARATAFGCAEAGVMAQERLGRVMRDEGVLPAVGPAWLPRAVVLVTVAADLLTAYTALEERARWWPSLATPADRSALHQRGAARLLETISSLGGILIKGAQFASTRPDLLPSPYITSFAGLQDRVPPRPWPVIADALTRALGRPLDEVFTTIDPQPLAAASLAQVHRARLHDGRVVAVKVQYPDIAELAGIDLAALEVIVDLLAQLAPTLRLQSIVTYLRQTIPLELDFRQEAIASARLRAALAHRTDVVVPAVIPELSSERLLVMDYVDGIKITDRAALLEAGIDPRRVAHLLNDVYAEQMLRHGILHADPHPGNLLVQPGPRLVLLDHGLNGALSLALGRALASMVRALMAGDADAVRAILAQVGVAVDEHADLTSLLRLVGVTLGGEHAGATGNARALGRSLSDLPVEVILVGRALSLLDGITRQLDPDLDVLAIVAQAALPGLQE
jgi:predicted unusual protein kinase regulating ubiquinone biosynthesis (AarF/ABC1/UbiB family)